MRFRLRRQVSSAHAIALLALFVALAGGAYAATTVLPKGSVGARQLKRGAVTPPKLAPATVKKLRGAKGATGPKGPRGTTGAKGAKGAKGDVGPTGPSDVYAGSAGVGPIGESLGHVASVGVPAGEYLLQAKLTVVGEEAGVAAAVVCQIAPTAAEGPETWDRTVVSLPAIASQLSSESAALAGGASFTSSQTVVLSCKTLFGSASFEDARVWAIRSGAVHGLPLLVH